MRIPYMAIGATAATFYGVMRASFDADAALAIQRHDPRLISLRNQLTKKGLVVTQQDGSPRDPIATMLRVTDRHQNRVDLLIGIRGMDPAAFSRTARGSLDGHPLNIVGLEDFVAMKIFAGNPQDLEDARGALKVSGKDVDLKLLRHLTARYGKPALKTLASLLSRD
ncbi:MAG: hypothetical protein HY737_01875 [Candidatus Omnitrophica bacterium]|nr:hypothetical protein [Candidatus Omnitrophota bacterium]